MHGMYKSIITSFAATVLMSVASCRPAPGPMPPVEIYFSPKGGATEAVVAALDATQSTAFVQAYSFTSKPIAQALVRAKQRGVLVQVILDKSNRSEKYTEADFLLHHGITPLIDAQHEIAHNKVMVLDTAVAITGSFNFTKQAENSNAENLIVIHDRSIAARYLANWQVHAAHSEPYLGRDEEPMNESSSHRASKTRKDR